VGLAARGAAEHSGVARRAAGSGAASGPFAELLDPLGFAQSGGEFLVQNVFLFAFLRQLTEGTGCRLKQD